MKIFKFKNITTEIKKKKTSMDGFNSRMKRIEKRIDELDDRTNKWPSLNE